MKVLVCGGRDFNNRDLMWDVLKQWPIDHIVSGAARGADTLVIDWAVEHNIGYTLFPANWTGYGRSAGPIRNQLMLDEARPDLVVAFPGGSGTSDMVNRAYAGGYRVYVVGGL